MDENGDVAERYGIRAIPALLVFRDGRVVDQRLGVAPRGELASLLDRQLEQGGVAAR